MSSAGTRRLRPSPAMAVSILALILAVVGTASALPGRNSVDSGDIKNGQVKKKDLNGSVKKGLFPPAARRGLTKAYALVLANGTVDPARSFRITSGNITTPQEGEYCFNLPFTVRHVQATAESLGSDLDIIGNAAGGRDFVVTARVRPDSGGGVAPFTSTANCPGTEDASVEITDPTNVGDGAGGNDDQYATDPIDAPFYVEFK